MKRYAYFAIRKTNTSAIPPPVIVQDLTRAYQAGETAFQDFKNNRLEPEKPLVKFHDTLKKQKLNTFANVTKAKRATKSKGDDTVLRADRNLFARMIITAESRHLHMQEVLQPSSGPLPSSLATSNGLPRKTNKAQLGRELEKLIEPTTHITGPSVYLIDGMALVQTFKVSDHMTFGQITDATLS